MTSSNTHHQNLASTQTCHKVWCSKVQHMLTTISKSGLRACNARLNHQLTHAHKAKMPRYTGRLLRRKLYLSVLTPVHDPIIRFLVKTLYHWRSPTASIWLTQNPSGNANDQASNKLHMKQKLAYQLCNGCLRNIHSPSSAWLE